MNRLFARAGNKSVFQYAKHGKDVGPHENPNPHRYITSSHNFYAPERELNQSLATTIVTDPCSLVKTMILWRRII